LRDGQQRVVSGRSRTTAFGQVQTVTVVAQIAGNQTFAAYVATRSGRAVSELNSEV